MSWEQVARQVERAVAIAVALAVLDQVTGHTVSARARALWSRATTPTPERVPSPEEITAVLSEATYHTRKAAENG